MAWLRAEARQGILGQDRVTIAVSVALLVLVFVARIPYDLLNHGPAVLNLDTPLDDLIPVVPAFVVPYVSLQPLIYLSAALFLLFRVRVFQSAALAMTATFLVSYLFYVFLQTYIDRPTLTAGDVFTRQIVAVYASDNPFNDFPSLHVSLSTILAIHWWRVDRRIGVPMAVWVILIVLSTVLVKQHHVLDIAGGLALAFSTSLLFRRLVLDHPVGPFRSPARPG
jgi:membrane-associated phospholipid phosphatase